MNAPRTKFHGFAAPGPAIDPFRIYAGLPTEIVTLHNVACFPEFDCLYDAADGARIPHTCIRRGPELNVESIGPSEVSIPRALSRYDNPLIYLGTVAWNFWGHLLTEGVSRTWVLRERTSHDLKALYFTRPGDRPWQPHVGEFLRYLKFDQTRLIQCEAPMLLSEVHLPAPSMVNRNHAYTGHTETHAEIAAQLWPAPGKARSSQPVYMSRRRLPELHRKIAHEAELENALAAAGVRIVCPEKLPFAEQIRLFNTHETFMGCIGSGFHSLLFAQGSPLRTVVLGDQAINANYPIVDALKHIQADYIRCLSIDVASRKIDRDRLLDVNAALEAMRALGIL